MGSNVKNKKQQAKYLPAVRFYKIYYYAIISPMR